MYTCLCTNNSRTSVFTVVIVVFSLVLQWQLVTQGRGESQEAGSSCPRGQRRLEARWVGRERDWDGVAVGKVLSLELLLLKHTQKIYILMLHFNKQCSTKLW